MSEQEYPVGKFSRVELIDHTENGKGRCFVKKAEEIKVELSTQDDRRTLKIFVSDKQE